MKQHLGCFHFPMEGKNKIQHKTEPSAVPGKEVGAGDPPKGLEDVVITPEAGESKPRAALGR